MAEPLCSTPILALTADAIAGAEERYLAEGVDAYLAKPITPAAVQAAIAGLAGRRRKMDVMPANTASVALALAQSSAHSNQGATPRVRVQERMQRPMRARISWRLRRRRRSRAPRDTSPAAPELLPAAVAELRRIFHPDQLDSFLADALDDIPRRIARLKERMSAGDLSAAMQEAHDLVSLTGNLGARRASNLARTVEQLCRADDPASAQVLFHEFAAAAAAALAELAVQRQLVA